MGEKTHQQSRCSLAIPENGIPDMAISLVAIQNMSWLLVPLPAQVLLRCNSSHTVDAMTTFSMVP